MIKIWLQTLGVTLIVTLAGILSNIITARFLGPEGRGFLASIILISSTASGISQFGFGHSYVYNKRINKNGGWTIVLLASISLTLLASFFISNYISKYIVIVNELRVAVIFSVMMALSVLMQTIFQSESNLQSFNKSKLIGSVGYIAILSGIYLFFEISVINVLYSNIAVVLLVVLYLVFNIKRVVSIDLCLPSAKDISRYVFYSANMHATVLLGMLIGNIDKFYMAILGGAKNFGLYSVAYGASRLIGLMQETLSLTLYSKFAGGDNKKAFSAVSMAFRVTFIPMVFCAAVIGFYGVEVMEHMFGLAFSGAGITFGILLMECVFSGGSWLLAQHFSAAGRPNLILFRQVISVVPILFLIWYIPENNSMEYIAALLLFSAILRMFATIFLYKVVFGENLKMMVPSISDYHIIRNLIRKKFHSTAA